MLYFAVILAAFWGLLWAIVLQFTPLGRYLAVRRTWITVAVGVIVDLAILAAVLPVGQWLPVCAVFAASGVAIAIRSLVNEWLDNTEALRDSKGRE